MALTLFTFFVLVACAFGAAVDKRAVFSNGHRATTVHSSVINEASGVCASRIHRDVLYTHNDSGGGHRIFAFSATSGSRLATIEIDGARSKDWEDIACGPCAGGSGHCIYVGDTGGNAGGHENTIYRIKEPAHIYDQHVHLDGTLKFTWDQHDCETLMVDPHGSIYVISKVSPGHHGKLVHLSSSGWNKGYRVDGNRGVYLSITAGSNGPVGGDISPNGKEVLIKTYGHVYHFNAPDGNIEAALQHRPETEPYIGERQGEAVCFSSDGNKFYTIGEGHNPPLYVYSKSGGSIVG